MRLTPSSRRQRRKYKRYGRNKKLSRRSKQPWMKRAQELKSLNIWLTRTLLTTDHPYSQSSTVNSTSLTAGSLCSSGWASSTQSFRSVRNLALLDGTSYTNLMTVISIQVSRCSITSFLKPKKCPGNQCSSWQATSTTEAESQMTTIAFCLCLFSTTAMAITFWTPTCTSQWTTQIQSLSSSVAYHATTTCSTISHSSTAEHIKFLPSTQSTPTSKVILTSCQLKTAHRSSECTPTQTLVSGNKRLTRSSQRFRTFQQFL